MPKALMGCGCAAVLFVLIAAIGIGGLAWYGIQQLDKFAAPFVEQGYQRTVAQIVDETKPVPVRRVYSAQTVTIREGSEDSLAMICQVAEVDGTVNGDLDFFGQTLTLKPDAAILGNLNAQGVQVLVIEGKVEGDVSFFGQALVVEAGGIVTGDVRSKGAQTINVVGQVLGDINGSYQELQRSADIDLEPQRIELE